MKARRLLLHAAKVWRVASPVLWLEVVQQLLSPVVWQVSTELGQNAYAAGCYPSRARPGCCKCRAPFAANSRCSLVSGGRCMV